MKGLITIKKVYNDSDNRSNYNNSSNIKYDVIKVVFKNEKGKVSV